LKQAQNRGGKQQVKIGSIVSLIKETFSEWSEDKASRLAAAMAYYTVFSIPPLLMIGIAIVGRVFGDDARAREQIAAQVSSVFGPSAAEAIETIVQNASEPEGSLIATVIGVIMLLLGASGVFGELQGTMNTIWEVSPRPDRGIMGMLRDRFFSFTMVLGIGFLLLVSLVVSAGLAALDEFLTGLLPEAVVLMQVVNFLISFGVFALLFALIFKVVPDVKIAWSDVWIGAIVTAALFTLGKIGIGLYLGNSALSSTYGAAGSLVALLVWVYYSAQILFLGAEFTQVYANKYGSRIVPAENAVPVTEEARAQQGIPHRETTEQAMREQDGLSQPALVRQSYQPLPGGRALATRSQSEEDGLPYYVIAVIALFVGVWRWLRGN
jgi:membrane protein